MNHIVLVETQVAATLASLKLAVDAVLYHNASAHGLQGKTFKPGEALSLLLSADTGGWLRPGSQHLIVSGVP